MVFCVKSILKLNGFGRDLPKQTSVSFSAADLVSPFKIFDAGRIYLEQRERRHSVSQTHPAIEPRTPSPLKQENLSAPPKTLLFHGTQLENTIWKRKRRQSHTSRGKAFALNTQVKPRIRQGPHKVGKCCRSLVLTVRGQVTHY